MLTSRGLGVVSSLAGDGSVCWVLLEPLTAARARTRHVPQATDRVTQRAGVLGVEDEGGDGTVRGGSIGLALWTGELRDEQERGTRKPSHS